MLVPLIIFDKPFHPKNEGWLGYIIKMNNTVVYHTGDSDKIPEMGKIKQVMQSM